MIDGKSVPVRGAELTIYMDRIFERAESPKPSDSVLFEMPAQ